MQAQPQPVPSPPEPHPAAEPKPDTRTQLHELLQVTEVDAASFFIHDLFCRRFNTTAAPDFPRHFIAFYRQNDHTYLPLGYVHQSAWEGCYLTGGLVIDERAYRRLPAAHRHIIRAAGGVAECLLRDSFALLGPDVIAIWGYVGDKQAEQVDLRVGFEHTEHPYLMVIWRQELSAAARADWYARALALGPF